MRHYNHFDVGSEVIFAGKLHQTQCPVNVAHGDAYYRHGAVDP